MARGGSRGKRQVALDELDEPDVLTFFFSDVEGSTQLAEQLETQAFARALEAHRALVRDAFEQHRGREISTGGDSFFAVFASVGDAVAAAVDVQRRLADPLDNGVRLRVRIGLHAGHAVRVGDDYLGLDVNRAARVADAGHGGQIVVSGAVRGALGRLDEGVALRDLGRHRLKDVGAERLWQVEADGLAAGPFPPPRSLEAHPSNLPTATAEFVGRDAEMSRLANLLAANQVVTVTGAGGIGKSRLAIETARSAIERFPDGVFYLDVSSLPNADAAAGALVDVLAIASTSDDPVHVLQKRLRDRDLLIVLDTADRVAAISALIASLAATCPHVKLLVTSRSPLHIAAERVLALGPLAATDAVRLFEERARAARPEWRADASTQGAVERLVDRLDAIPLAIELAAARIRILTPKAILDRLERQLPALADAPSDMPDRQRTLNATIAWSFEQLDPGEQRLFARLGVFVAAFGLDAVDGVAGEGDVDSLAVLDRLVDRSLVATDESSEMPGFRLLAPIREFAGQVLRASGEEEALRERHARYHLELLRSLSDALDSPDDLAAVGAIEHSQPHPRGTPGRGLDDGRKARAPGLGGGGGGKLWGGGP